MLQNYQKLNLKNKNAVVYQGVHICFLFLPEILKFVYGIFL